ncbi:MAG: hypothetical protein ACOH2N_18720 [Devosia sp.]
MAFEAAAVVGVRLFDTSPTTLANYVANAATTLTLMPRSVRTATTVIDDDF